MMESKRWGKFKVVFGKRLKTRGRNPICPMCENPVLPDQYGMYIRSLGEYGREFHDDCIRKFAKWILFERGYHEQPEDYSLPHPTKSALVVDENEGKSGS